MAISEHPKTGTILLCDFNAGFTPPEMTKRRPVVVLSPKIGNGRSGLCTVVPLSTKVPIPIRAYHLELVIAPPLPAPWDAGPNWVKGDMVVTVGFHRLDFVRLGKDTEGKRRYYVDPISDAALRDVRYCVLCGLGLVALTRHLP